MISASYKNRQKPNHKFTFYDWIVNGVKFPFNKWKGDMVFYATGMIFKSIEQELNNSSFIYQNPKNVSYKFAKAPRILNDSWILDLRTKHTK